MAVTTTRLADQRQRGGDLALGDVRGDDARVDMAFASMRSLIRRICFGPNAAATSRRSLVCLGGTIPMID